MIEIFMLSLNLLCLALSLAYGARKYQRICMENLKIEYMEVSSQNTL